MSERESRNDRAGARPSGAGRGGAGRGGAGQGGARKGGSAPGGADRRAIAARLGKRRAARYAAVQALYEIELTGRRPAEVADEFAQWRLADILEPFEADGMLEPGPGPKLDRSWFAMLTLGAAAAVDELDPHLEKALAEGWSLSRCGYLMRAILRAGAYELQARPDVPVAVVIKDYIALTEIFLEGDEPQFVHAVLDRARRALRPEAGAGA